MSASLNAQQLAERAAHAEDLASRSRQRAADAAAAVAPAQSRLASAQDAVAGAEREVIKAADDLAGQAGKAGLVEATAQFLPGRDTERLRQAARLRSSAAQEARRRIEVRAAAARALDTAADKAQDARGRAAAAQEQAAERDRAVEAAITAVAELLAAWSQAIDARVRPPAELVEAWTRQVSELAGAARPAPVLAAAVGRDYLIPARRPLDQQRAGLDQALRDAVAEHASVGQDLAAASTERDPRPRDPEFWSRRERPGGVTAAGAPLWRLVEAADPAAPVAHLEAALDAPACCRRGSPRTARTWTAGTAATWCGPRPARARPGRIRPPGKTPACRRCARCCGRRTTPARWVTLCRGCSGWSGTARNFRPGRPR